MNSFSNSVVLITGASAGIGEALALQFASLEADLILVARRQDRLDSLASKIRSLGRKVEVLACDITKQDQLEVSIQQARKAFSKIDIVIANAGYSVAGKLEKLSVQSYREQFETNIFGMLNTIYSTLEDLKKSKGRLVLIGSVAGYVGLPGSSAYVMSKHAVRGLAQSLRGELSSYGISVIHVSPGFIDTEIRKVDNQGVYRPEAKDPIPAWIRMPSAKAAAIIIQGIKRRKAEIVVTLHGKLIVALVTHLPEVFNLLIRVTGARGRSTPSEQ